MWGGTSLELFRNVCCTSGMDLALADSANLFEELSVCRHLQLKVGVHNVTTGGNVIIPPPSHHLEQWANGSA